MTTHSYTKIPVFVYTWSTADVRIRCYIALQPCTAAQRLRGLPNIYAVLVLVFFRLPRYYTHPAPRPAAVWAPADRRRTMKQRRAPQRHIPRCSFQMTQVAHIDQASSTCSSPTTRHIPAKRQKVAYHRLLNAGVLTLRDTAAT